MTYRRRGYRAGSRPASSFRRDARYEISKEGLGKFLEKLGEWTGAALGMAAGAAAAKHGLPLSPTVASGAGLVAGAAAGAAAKGTLVVGLEQLKQRRSARRDREQVGGRAAHAPRGARRGTGTSHYRSAASAIRASGVVSAGAVINEIERAISELERIERDLMEVVDRIQNTHGWIRIVLTGGRAEFLQQINFRMSAAKAAVIDSCGMLRLSKDSLRGYLRSI